ncbi:hypothetical protein GCM10009743_62090 [Kribbella swartbergensis]
MSTRSRSELLKTSTIEEANADEEKAPDYNVAPTKTSPAVLARPPRSASDDAEPVRQLRNVKCELVAVAVRVCPGCKHPLFGGGCREEEGLPSTRGTTVAAD